MPKSKKQKHRKRTYRKRKKIERKLKHSKRAGMHRSTVGVFATKQSKNSMITDNKKLKKQLNLINEIKKNMKFSEKKILIIKKYLDDNREEDCKEMPDDDVIEQLEGKEQFYGLLPDSEEYYDLLEEEYDQENYYLEGLKQELEEALEKIKLHEKAKEHEKRIGIYKPNAPTGNF